MNRRNPGAIGTHHRRYNQREITMILAIIILIAAWAAAVGNYILAKQEVSDVQKKFETCIGQLPFEKGDGDIR